MSTIINLSNTTFSNPSKGKLMVHPLFTGIEHLVFDLSRPEAWPSQSPDLLNGDVIREMVTPANQLHNSSGVTGIFDPAEKSVTFGASSPGPHLIYEDENGDDVLLPFHSQQTDAYVGLYIYRPSAAVRDGTLFDLTGNTGGTGNQKAVFRGQIYGDELTTFNSGEAIATTIPTDQWTHAAVYARPDGLDGAGRHYLFINGVQVASELLTITAFNDQVAGNATSIGGKWGGAHVRLRYASIYHGILATGMTAQELAALDYKYVQARF